jgi:putative endonuclease
VNGKPCLGNILEAEWVGVDGKPPVKWYVYIIKSEKSGVLYTGIATDIKRRLQEHNEGKGAKFTRGRGPWEMYYWKRYDTKGEALRVEAKVKKLPKGRKLDACSDNPYFVGSWPWDPD